MTYIKSTVKPKEHLNCLLLIALILTQQTQHPSHIPTHHSSCMQHLLFLWQWELNSLQLLEMGSPALNPHVNKSLPCLWCLCLWFTNCYHVDPIMGHTLSCHLDSDCWGREIQIVIMFVVIFLGVMLPSHMTTLHRKYSYGKQSQFLLINCFG